MSEGMRSDCTIAEINQLTLIDCHWMGPEDNSASFRCDICADLEPATASLVQCALEFALNTPGSQVEFRRSDKFLNPLVILCEHPNAEINLEFTHYDLSEVPLVERGQLLESLAPVEHYPLGKNLAELFPTLMGAESLKEDRSVIKAITLQQHTGEKVKQEISPINLTQLAMSEIANLHQMQNLVFTVLEWPVLKRTFSDSWTRIWPVVEK